jgi:hypothetical protein
VSSTSTVATWNYYLLDSALGVDTATSTVTINVVVSISDSVVSVDSAVAAYGAVVTTVDTVLSLDTNQGYAGAVALSTDTAVASSSSSSIAEWAAVSQDVCTVLDSSITSAEFESQVLDQATFEVLPESSLGWNDYVVDVVVTTDDAQALIEAVSSSLSTSLASDNLFNYVELDASVFDQSFYWDSTGSFSTKKQDAQVAVPPTAVSGAQAQDLTVPVPRPTTPVRIAASTVNPRPPTMTGTASTSSTTARPSTPVGVAAVSLDRRPLPPVGSASKE